MGKTYIFFEPKNRGFFKKIANTYTELVKKYYEDAEKAYAEGEWLNFFKNYVHTLIFPACDYNGDLQCPGTLCRTDKCPVLTVDLKDQVINSLHNVICSLRTIPAINNSIVDRIRIVLFSLLDKKTISLNYRYNHTLPHYLQLMRGVSGITDVENLVYVCPENSNYGYFKKEMLKSNKKVLEACVYYQ